MHALAAAAGARIPVRLAPVEETLMIPLWARAEESGRADAVLRDPSAARIRARLDYDFERFADARASQVGCCVRGRRIDTWVCDHLAAHPGTTIVDLGCGLDGRFERTDDGRARWFEVDLPDVIALRQAFFPETGRRTMLAASVLDEGWLDAIEAASAGGPVLFVTEGMLPYLQATQVRSLFGRLAARFPGATILFDAMSPLVIRHQDHHDAMRHVSARFTWGLADITDLASWGIPLRVEATERFHDLLAGSARRLPRRIRWFGRIAGALYPPFKRAYTLHRAHLG